VSAVGAVVVASAIVSAIASRLTYRRRRLRWFAEQFRRAREQSAIPSTYAPATGSQRADRDVLAAEPPPSVTVLGDVVQMRAHMPPLVLRWFVDAAGTTFGCVGMVSSLRMMRLYSSDGTNVYTTVSTTETSRLVVEWRASQMPDALLEYDLRALLGRNYDRYAKALARHLKLEVPKARLLS
jgi:hypothetical protein